MIVERAKHNELTELVRLCRRLHAESSWAWVNFSPAMMRKSLKSLISKPDYTVLVAKDREGEMRGLLIGSVDCFLYSRIRYATDLEFVAEQGGAELLEAFKGWAKGVGAKVLVMGDSNSGREAAKDRFFKIHGFEKSGGIYQVKV